MGTWPAAGNLAVRTLTQLWGFSMAFQRRKVAAALAYAVGHGSKWLALGIAKLTPID